MKPPTKHFFDGKKNCDDWCAREYQLKYSICQLEIMKTNKIIEKMWQQYRQKEDCKNFYNVMT